MSSRITALLLLLLVMGCTHTPQPSGRGRFPAPNPNGCYVIVYEGADFRGVGDVFNGPGRWRRLHPLTQTNETNWRNRIRSLHVGSLATVTVFTDEDFRGESQRLSSATDHPRLDARVSGRVESLEIACPRMGGAATVDHGH
jgi:hypothetical protein